MIVWVCYFAACGAVLGSFIDTAIGRLKGHLSLVFPLSRCDVCHRHLAFYELVPIFSYVLLGGQCRQCHTKIGARTLIYEIVGAGAGAAAVLLGRIC